jgi:hypothetical protein
MILFSFTFLRQKYTMSSTEVSPVFIGTFLLFIFGSLSGADLIGVFGRKWLAVTSTVVL